MKITPDSSLFSALSKLPNPAEVRRRAAPPGQAEGQQAVDPARREKDARDAIVRQALREAAHRQAALRQSAPEAGNAPAARSASATDAASAVTAGSASASRGSVSREAPFAETRPQFVRLGQFVDISV